MAPRRTLLLAFAAPAALGFLLLFLWPLVGVVAEALTGGGSAFVRLAADPVFWSGLRGSAILGTLAPAVSTAVGFCVAFHLAGMAPARRTLVLFLISLPLTFSGLIVAYGFILAFGRAGFVTLLLAELGADPAVVGGAIFSPAGLGFAYCYYLIPRAVLVILPALVNFDRDQLLAARACGAGALRAYWDILLPQVKPSLLAAFCLTAAVAIGAYGTALALVGTQVAILPLVLYSRISDTGSDLPAAAAASLVLMALCCAVMALAEIGLLRRRLPAGESRPARRRGPLPRLERVPRRP